jgi:hypothetical protein
VNASIFLAKLIGPVLLVLGTGMLVNGKAFRPVIDEIVRNRAVVVLFGLMTMSAGLAVVLTHNVWVADWPVLITILGWLSLIAGGFRLLTPQDAIKFGRKMYEQSNGLFAGAVIWVAIGAVLCFFGYLQ